MKNIIWTISILGLLIHTMQAQGPAITSDSPIMIGSQRSEIRTLMEYRKTEHAEYFIAPIQFSRTFTKDLLLGAKLPMIHQISSIHSDYNSNSFQAGDLQLFAKYQFYRKDRTAKTLRMVLKAVENLPKGQFENVHMVSMQQFQSYKALVVGYETLRMGISNELGINWVPGNPNHDIRYNLSFGLPLLEPVYPTRQINLYFDYSSIWEFNTGDYYLFYAQGVQFARDNFTVELALQLPLYQQGPEHMIRKIGLMLGSRVIL
jgi:hypothetical protein